MGTSARDEFQRDVARIALAATHQYGFALAGSGAIREHQLTDRPTEDVDLFTVISHRNSFSAAVTAVRYELAKRADNGFTLEYFAMRLQLAERLQPRQVEQYGLSAHDLQTVKASLIEWAAEIDKFL